MQIENFDTNSDITIKGPKLIVPKIHIDERGLFYESWNQEKFDQIVGQNITFVQDNHSISHLNVLRGLHFQKYPYAQGKLVRCTKGKIFDVAIDLRIFSSFRKY